MNMIRIKNPFLQLNDYNCFGCSPNNPIGLKLNFFVEGDEVFAKWTPHKNYQGWTNILHGGIQATLMDEISSWVVFTFLKTSGVTVKMNIKLLKGIYISDGEITIKAKLISKKHNLATIEASILNSKKEICSEGEFVYFVYPKEKAIEYFHFPTDDNVFFEEV